MKAIAWAALLLGSVGVWQLGSRLSVDALAMLTGLIFGGLVAVPVSLLVVYTVRNSEPPPQRRRVDLVDCDSLSRRLLE
jgi:hypothetical protein